MTQNKTSDPAVKIDHRHESGPANSHPPTFRATEMRGGTGGGNANQTVNSMGAKGSMILAGLAIALCVMAVVALTVGRYPVSIGELLRLVWSALWHHDTMAFGASSTVLFHVRLPRMCAAVLVGMAL
ncbi:MAG TPA: hypothetical protein VKF42_10955, partial [Chitinivibrionales bacterium]|nr:hypothetical protein [Chitinivibrionales bacterium]